MTETATQTQQSVKLSQMKPNRMYCLDANVIFVHRTPDYTTAIIEEEGTQKQMKLKNFTVQPQRRYRFGLCYHGDNDWLHARNPGQTIVEIGEANQPTIRDIREVSQFQNQYISTVLMPVHSSCYKDTFRWSCYASGCVISVSGLGEANPNILNKWLLIKGLLVRRTDSGYKLIGGVFTSVEPWEHPMEDRYSPQINCRNLSVAVSSTISSILGNEKTSNSCIVDCGVFAIATKTYVGCVQCKKKLSEDLKCPSCGDTMPTNYTYHEATLHDVGSHIDYPSAGLQAAIFIPEIAEMLSHVHRHAAAKLQLRSTRNDSGLLMHRIVAIDSIQF